MENEKRELILESNSPDGVWQLMIFAPIEMSNCFYAEFKQGRFMSSFPFGKSGPASGLSLDWNLPDKVCAIYIDGRCFVLFRYGAKRRRNRENWRVSPQKPFSSQEIDWVCAQKHVRHK